MKHPVIRKYHTAALFLALQLLCSCGILPQRAAAPISGEDWFMSTFCSVTVYEAEGLSESDIKQVINGAFAKARELERVLSKTEPESDVYRFNESPCGCPVSDDTKLLIEKALSFYRYEASFDITAGALTDLWDFTGTDPAVPAREDIAKALLHCGQSLEISRSSGNAQLPWLLSKKDPEAKLDLGALAKGYICDMAAGYLKENGVTSAIVNFGGDGCLIGAKPDGSPWAVGVEAPDADKTADYGSRRYAGVLSMGEGAVATSGTYERCFEEDGVLYHHILDPRTGFPCETDAESVTVTGPDCCSCDALATVCLIRGSEEALKLIESLEGFECLIIKTDGTVIGSSGTDYRPEQAE